MLNQHACAADVFFLSTPRLSFLQEYQAQKTAACAATASDAASVEVSCPANLVKIFEEGLVVEVVQYKSGYDRDIHIIYESDRHESDVNRFRPHSIVLGSAILFTKPF